MKTVTIIRHSIRDWGADLLIEQYAAWLMDEGVEVNYWVNKIYTQRVLDKRLKIHHIPLNGVVGTIVWAMMKKHSNSLVCVDLVLMALLAGMRNRNHLVYIAQDYDPTYYRSILWKSLMAFCYKIVLDKWHVKTVCVSQSLHDKLKKHTTRSMHVIPNGIDVQAYTPLEQKTTPLPRQTPYVIIVFAREDYRKGWDIALKAFELLGKLRNQDDWSVWVLGQNNREHIIKNYKQWGYISDINKLKQILISADMFLLPSRSEGLSLLLLQAMASGLAIVATEAAGIIRHQVDGLVSEINDYSAIAKNLDFLMSDPYKLDFYKKASRIRVDDFNISYSKRDWLKFVNDNCNN